MRAAGYEKHKVADGKITYIIDLRITDGELKQIYEELGDATPNEENISATPTFRRIWECLYAKMKSMKRTKRTQKLRRRTHEKKQSGAAAATSGKEE